ncbi:MULTISPECIES: phosphodiesterase [Acinetobacter]|uniref:phosphodiesterase n=1 Tax=Acinetobacter TaxID=469 RepID=UPI0024812605|nr:MULTISPECIES: phosphodiesterase [Acinetobacter]
MMKILSHRGYWKEASEKNSVTAFLRSFNLNFGTETDLRDQNGEIVISHDIPKNDSLLFKNFLKALNDKPLTLALNVKADGLAKELKKILQGYPELNYFVFDMSIPDMKSYLDLGISVFTRVSDVEQIPIWLEYSDGIWLDAFSHDWYDIEVIHKLLATGKQVCVVSPELHKRDYNEVWNMLYPLRTCAALMLCTDFPEDAHSFFFGE